MFEGGEEITKECGMGTIALPSVYFIGCDGAPSIEETCYKTNHYAARNESSLESNPTLFREFIIHHPDNVLFEQSPQQNHIQPNDFGNEGLVRHSIPPQEQDESCPNRNGLHECNCVQRTAGTVVPKKQKPKKCTSPSQQRKRQPQKKWDSEEIERLRVAVSKHGTAKGKWPVIAKDVGTRNTSGCINKWRSLEKKRRWNKEDSEMIQRLMREGRTYEEIKALMPDCTITQINQHYGKFKANHEEWENYEYEQLKVWILNKTDISFTEMGRMLNNRHRDDVKCRYNAIKSQLSEFERIE